MIHPTKLKINNNKPLGKIRRIVKRIRKSITLTEKFANQCKVEGKPERKLVKDMPVRWNSTYDMLSIALCYQKEICAVVATTSALQQLQLQPEDWNILSSIKDFLLKFKEATDRLQLKGSPSLCHTFIIYNKLFDHLDKLDEKSPIFPASRKAFDKLSKYYSKTDDHPVYSISAVLNPKLKMSYFRIKRWESRLIKKIEREFRNAFITYSTQATPKKKELDWEMADIYDGDEEGIEEVDELSRYLVDVVAQDPLSFWKSNEATFPILASMARDYMSIPGSTASIERTFSGGQDLITPTRSSLKSKTISKCMSLKNWVKELP